MTAAAQRQSMTDLGRYEVLFRLASGGMAEVFVARQRGEGGFERVVAIKRMLAHIADDDRFVAMFLDEARLAAYISSPHVVQTLDVDVDDQGSPFIVMDLVIGLTLAQILRASSARKAFIPVGIATEMLAQAGDGLYDAHNAVTPTGLALNIVHRDVSPQNTLVGIDGRIRIMDFGVARALARVTKTSTGEFKGKISYFSPEQAEGRELDCRSDVFAHGIVAWETYVGSRLFKSENPLSVLDAIRNQPIPLVSELRPEVPEAIAKVVAKALERKVEDRYQDARTFSRDLRRAAEALPDPPDARAVGLYVKDISGTVLDQMQQRISEAFQRNSVIDADGRASVPSMSGKSKLRFIAQRNNNSEDGIENLVSEPPPPDSMSPGTSVVKKQSSLLDGAPSMPGTRLSNVDPRRTPSGAIRSDNPTMVGSQAGRYSQIHGEAKPGGGRKVLYAGIALALVGVSAAVAYVSMSKPPAAPVQATAPAPTTPPAQGANPVAPTPPAQPINAEATATPIPEVPANPAPNTPVVSAAGGRRPGRTVAASAAQAAPAAAPQVITNTITVQDPAALARAQVAEEARRAAEARARDAEEARRIAEERARAASMQQAAPQRGNFEDEF
jgi:serine/threonine protein kinase